MNYSLQAANKSVGLKSGALEIITASLVTDATGAKSKEVKKLKLIEEDIFQYKGKSIII